MVCARIRKLLHCISMCVCDSSQLPAHGTLHCVRNMCLGICLLDFGFQNAQFKSFAPHHTRHNGGSQPSSQASCREQCRRGRRTSAEKAKSGQPAQAQADGEKGGIERSARRGQVFATCPPELHRQSVGYGLRDDAQPPSTRARQKNAPVCAACNRVFCTQRHLRCSHGLVSLGSSFGIGSPKHELKRIVYFDLLFGLAFPQRFRARSTSVAVGRAT